MEEKIKSIVEKWERRCYTDGIPDEAPTRLEELNKVISYRKLCMAILKNDNCLKSLGLNVKKPEIYHEYKKIQLGIKERQLKLF